MLTPEALVADPMYQLNLLLWLLQPLQEDYPLRPILRQGGLGLIGIGHPLGIADPGLRERLAAAQVGFGPASEIDILADRQPHPHFVLLECKSTLEWLLRERVEQTRQAQSFLLQTGAQLNRALGLPVTAPTRSWLLYLSAWNGRSNDASARLASLARALSGRGFDVAQTGVLWLHVDDDGVGHKTIRMRLDTHEGNVPLTDAVRQELRQGAVIQNIVDGEDPRPLYYVPFDPTAFDGRERDDPDARENFEYCRRVFRDRVLQRFVCDLGVLKTPGALLVDPTTYLEEALMGVYAKCERGGLGRELRRQVRLIVRDALKPVRSSHRIEILNHPPQAVKISVLTDDAKEKLLDALSSIGDQTALLKTLAELEQLDPPTLFSSLDDAQA